MPDAAAHPIKDKTRATDSSTLFISEASPFAFSASPKIASPLRWYMRSMVKNLSPTEITKVLVVSGDPGLHLHRHGGERQKIGTSVMIPHDVTS
jgi:hypothetical protein